MCRAGESGAVMRIPPSPYQWGPICTAGKKRGSAAEAMTWETVNRVWRARRPARSQVDTSRPCTHTTDWPVVKSVVLMEIPCSVPRCRL